MGSCFKGSQHRNFKLLRWPLAFGVQRERRLEALNKVLRKESLAVALALQALKTPAPMVSKDGTSQAGFLHPVKDGLARLCRYAVRNVAVQSREAKGLLRLRGLGGPLWSFSFNRYIAYNGEATTHPRTKESLRENWHCSLRHSDECGPLSGCVWRCCRCSLLDGRAWRR